jgi:hypothetical protein
LDVVVDLGRAPSRILEASIEAVNKHEGISLKAPSEPVGHLRERLRSCLPLHAQQNDMAIRALKEVAKN